MTLGSATPRRLSGRAPAAEGVGLVYGGGGDGLMGRLARATLAAGGHVTGVIPSFLRPQGTCPTAAHEMIVVEDMHDRKQAMFDRADAFVALPGGVGTLEELVEQMTWAQLNRHAKPILIANIGGFWRPLLALFAHMHIEGFIREGFDMRYLVAERIEDVLPMLRAAAASGGLTTADRWTPSRLATCNGGGARHQHCRS